MELIFGWTNPCAVVAVALDGDNRGFVVDEVYRSRLSEDDLIAECKLLESKWGRGVFWCDASEPRTINALRRAGINARANKSKRDDGIRELGGRFKDAGDGRRRLYISPSCVNLIEELQLYDPKKKEHDHACFVEGTLIKTNEGYKPIEEIDRGDQALTRLGPNKIIYQGITNKQADIVRLTTSNGEDLYGTANHPIWVEGLGFQRMDSLRYALIIDSLRYPDRKWLKKSFTKGKHIADTLIPQIDLHEFIIDQKAGVENPSTFIEKYTRIITEKYPRDITYTISMITLLIMIQKTLNAYQKTLTYHTTLKKCLKTKNTKKDNSNTSPTLDPSLNNGTPQKKDINGIANTGNTHLRKHSKKLRKHAKSVGTSSPIDHLTNLDDSARINARQHGEENPASMTKNVHVLYAELYSRLINTIKPVPVHVVAVENLRIKESVYNLTVNKQHEYYANNILVSNCDALRYAMMGAKGRGEVEVLTGKRPR